jgi:hypothetical protein
LWIILFCMEQMMRGVIDSPSLTMGWTGLHDVRALRDAETTVARNHA